MPNAAQEDAPTARWEGPLLWGLLLVALALNLLTGDRCPAVWVDEAAYTDPAWNLYLGRRFTSSAWYAQGPDKFWAGNVPLYPALLYVWMGAFGCSILAVRGLNYALMTISTFLLWLAVKRLGLIRLPRYRITMVVLLLSGFGVCFSYRSGRPDAICILLASAATLACSIPHPASRLVTLGALGVLLPMAALQLVVFAGVICLLMLLLRARCLGEAVSLGAGCLVGGLLLFALYRFHGVWDDFLASTILRHSVIGVEGLPGRLGRLRIPGGLKDPSFVLVMLTVLGISAWMALRRQFVWRSPLGFAVLVGVGLPLVLDLLRGEFPCYYSWMVYIPVCICLCAVLADNVKGTGSAGLPVVLRHGVIPGVLGLACVVGLPFVVGLSVMQWRDRDYRRIEDLVQAEVRPGDCAYCDGAAYYALKGRALVETGYRRLEAMTPQQKQRVSVLVIDPKSRKAVERAIGGRWRACGEALRPSRPPLWAVQSEYFLDQYHLQAFRRERQEKVR